MVVTIFGATGLVGSKLVHLALAKSFTVKAFGRNVDKLIDADLDTDKLEAIKGYVFDEADVYDALEGSDAVLSVLGGAFDGTDKTRSLGIKNIITQMERANVSRIVALGGLGILNAEDDTLLLDKPGYPKMYLPVSKEHLQAYRYLSESNLDYTFVCAPNILDEEPTNHYITNATYPPQPNNGKITAGDLASFMLAELEHGKYLKQKVGISN